MAGGLLAELRERIDVRPDAACRELKRYDHLLRAGDRDLDVYLVREGTLRACRIIAGEEQIIRFGYAGDFIFAVDAFLSGQPTEVYVQAIRACKLTVIPADRLRALADGGGEDGRLWRRVLRWLILGFQEREVDLLTPRPEDRYRRVLERSPRLFQEIPLKYIANYLRMSPETLSRIRKS